MTKLYKEATQAATADTQKIKIFGQQVPMFELRKGSESIKKCLPAAAGMLLPMVVYKAKRRGSAASLERELHNV